MAIVNLTTLTQKRWALPVLALLSDGAAARAYPLSQALPCSRATISDVLVHLIELGLLTHNPGHGHPLRPEVLLTQAGHEMAQMAKQFWQNSRSLPDTGEIVLGRWALPVLQQTLEQTRYANLRKVLTPVTDRALSLSLKSLIGANLLNRQVDMNQHPPASYYHASRQGRMLVEPFAGIAL